MASTPIPDRHQSSLLQEVTPLKGIFSQDSITGPRIEGRESAISNPPSYATHDPFNESASKNPSIYDTTSERSLNLSFAEQPRQESKTMTGDDEDQENAEQLEQEINTSPRTARAEAAARAARAAEQAIDQHRRVFENMQRLAEQTAQRIADQATDSARP